MTYWNSQARVAGSELAGKLNYDSASATLAASEGIMVCPTNSGVVVAVDIMSRSLLWARSYRSIKQQAADEGPNGRIRRGGFNPNGARSARHTADIDRSALIALRPQLQIDFLTTRSATAGGPSLWIV